MRRNGTVWDNMKWEGLGGEGMAGLGMAWDAKG